ncbi:MAG: tyrosine-type recombinase/integrase [Coriobacteriales bacterium]
MLRRHHISPCGRRSRPPSSPGSASSRPRGPRCAALTRAAGTASTTSSTGGASGARSPASRGLKFHGLRYTQVTQLLANGADVKTVQTRLGHANASITPGRYAHAIPEKDH